MKIADTYNYKYLYNCCFFIRRPKEYVIADFGCGEGRLADSVKQKVHSLDLVAVNDKIIACDMAHTPLLTNGINAVVFCLSLMGTNLVDYILEANRVLKMEYVFFFSKF